MHHSPILHTHHLAYTYPGGVRMEYPDLKCSRGGRLLITGQSGTGKTTLLHLISGLLRVQHGQVSLAGEALHEMSQGALDRFRGSHIGLVFQQPRFISALSVVDNLKAAQYFGTGRSSSGSAMELLAELGIAHYANKFTGNLSGGERQRLAIARALAAKPAVVMADEPTSSLDDDNAMLVYELLVRECSQNDAALVVVTHDQRLKEKFDDVVLL